MSKITLEYPYNQDWKHGYVVTNGENRKNVILYNSHDDRSTTSYARYLYSVNKGRYLSDTEHVDHIDNDKTNDSIENLQILTLEQNSAKEGKRRGRVLVEMVCPSCSSPFTRRMGNTHLVPSLTGKITSCSKSCGHAMTAMRLGLEERIKISENSVVRVFRSHS